MRNNPFTSEIFNTVWLKHFYDSKPSYKFNFIKNVSFYKKVFLPVYINVGKNLTKGVFYRLQKEHNDFKGKIFLLYDIPDYFNVNEQVDFINKKLGVKKIYQYKGYDRKNLRVLISLDAIKSGKSGKSPTQDYPVSWVKSYGKGRVFYSNFGHNKATWWTPFLLEHFLAGIRWSVGELDGLYDSLPQPPRL